MNLKILTVTAMLWFCFSSLTAYSQAEEAGQSYPFRIYMLLWRGITEAEKGFMDHLVKSGKEVDFIIRNCDKNRMKLKRYKQEIRDMKPDLIYTFGTTVTTAVAGTINDRNNSTFIHDIPILFNVVGDPVGARLVTTLESPERNLTGVSQQVPLQVQVERMRAVFEFKRLAVIYNPAEYNSIIEVKQLEQLAAYYHFKLIKIQLTIDTGGKLKETVLLRIMTAGIRQKPDLIYLPSDSLVISEAKRLLELFHFHRLPTFSATEEPIRKDGALMGLVCRYYDLGKIAALNALQILEHKKKCLEIPIRMMQQFTFLVNNKTVEQLNIDIPGEILRFAEVICECN